MPANAAGEWIAFDAADPKTWPEKTGWYLAWDVIGGAAYWTGTRWLDPAVPKFYAAILPPGESPEEGK